MVEALLLSVEVGFERGVVLMSRALPLLRSAHVVTFESRFACLHVIVEQLLVGPRTP